MTRSKINDHVSDKATGPEFCPDCKRTMIYSGKGYWRCTTPDCPVIRSTGPEPRPNEAEGVDASRYEPDRARRCNAVKRDGDLVAVCNRTACHPDEHERWSYTGIRIEVWPSDQRPSEATPVRDREHLRCKVICSPECELMNAFREPPVPRPEDVLSETVRAAERERIATWIHDEYRSHYDNGNQGPLYRAYTEIINVLRGRPEKEGLR